MLFPVSGVEVMPWVPPLVAFVIAFFGSMTGVSGAFLLLPFQMSVLGFTTPGVSPTNLIYNMVGTPAGVFSYVRQRKMFWPLAIVILIGQLPGLLLGIYIRVAFLLDTRSFKVFVAVVLLMLFMNLLRGIFKPSAKDVPKHAVPGWGQVGNCRWSAKEVSCVFEEETFRLATLPLLAVSCVIGIIGGAYGIGGAAIMSPLLVGVMGIPIYIVAGSTLLANVVASAFGVLTYQFAGPLFHCAEAVPDWRLGLLFGVGGLFGMYLGARMQKHVPARWIKAILGAAMVYVAFRYLHESLLH